MNVSPSVVVVYPRSVWYDPLQKQGDHAMKNTDVLGRLIKPGDVCGFASRRGSHTHNDVVIIREVKAEGIRGDKLTKVWTKETGWSVKLVPTHRIQVSENLTITGLSEKEAVELMRIRSER